MYRLGKRPPRIKKKTLTFNRLLKGLPAIPGEFDLDTEKNIPCRMMGNNKYGNCVIVGRANQTLRFEYSEQGEVINITDKEVLRQYFKEGKATCWNKYPDNGLVMLDSLTSWWKDGWIADGKKYNISGFAKIDIDKYYLRAAMYLLNGVNVGLSLPDNYDDEVWENTDGKPNPQNGHCVYIPPICDKEGLYCITWGQPRKRMSWDYALKYIDESYAIVDDKNRFDGKSDIDVELLNSYLNSLR
jgi:hypothetical protein